MTNTAGPGKNTKATPIRSTSAPIVATMARLISGRLCTLNFVSAAVKKSFIETLQRENRS
jgi:hypothetical protein